MRGKRRLVQCAVCALAMSLAACGRGGQAPSADGSSRGTARRTLIVWDWHAADPTRGPGLWLAEIDRAFRKAHPDVDLKHVAQSHTEYYEIFTAAAAAASPERGPDVVMLHQGSRILDNKEHLTDLTQWVTPAFRQEIAGWELTCDGYRADGTPYAVPVAVQGNVWYVNKALLRRAGVPTEPLPSTWQELLAACDRLRSIGKAGVAAGMKEGFWAEWFVNSAYQQELSARDVAALREGRLSWTDPRVARLFERFKELSDRKCVQEGALSTPLLPDAAEVFMRGDAGFFLGLISDVAHWKDFGEMLGPENLGVMTCPVWSGRSGPLPMPTGGAFAYGVTRWSREKDLAFEYIAFVANAANARTFLTQVGSFPANRSVDAGALADPSARTIHGWLSTGRTARQMTETFPAEVSEALRREGQRLWSGQTTVRQALEALEKVALNARKRGTR